MFVCRETGGGYRSRTVRGEKKQNNAANHPVRAPLSIASYKSPKRPARKEASRGPSDQVPRRGAPCEKLVPSFSVRAALLVSSPVSRMLARETSGERDKRRIRAEDEMPPSKREARVHPEQRVEPTPFDRVLQISFENRAKRRSMLLVLPSWYGLSLLRAHPSMTRASFKFSLEMLATAWSCLRHWCVGE